MSNISVRISILLIYIKFSFWFLRFDSCRYMRICTRTGAPWLCSCRAWARQHSPCSLSCPRRMANRSGDFGIFFDYLIWVKCTNLLLLGFGNTWSKVGVSGNYERGGKGFLSIPYFLLIRHGNQCCGSMTFCYVSGCGSGCGSGSCYFRQWPSRRQQKSS